MNGEGRAKVVVGDRGFGCDGRDMMRHVLPFLVSAIAIFFTGCSRDQSGPPIEEAVVVFRAADGRTLTMADLRGATGTFRYEILDKSNVPKEAASLHKQAAWQAGKATTSRQSTFSNRHRDSRRPGAIPFMTWLTHTC